MPFPAVRRPGFPAVGTWSQCHGRFPGPFTQPKRLQLMMLAANRDHLIRRWAYWKTVPTPKLKLFRESNDHFEEAGEWIRASISYNVATSSLKQITLHIGQQCWMSSQQNFVSFSTRSLKFQTNTPLEHKKWQKPPTVQQKKKAHHFKKTLRAGWVNGDATRVFSFHRSLWRFGGLGSLFVQQIFPPRLLWSIGSIWQPGFFS